MRLAGKNSIVTGAAHGIGRAIAELFAENGARVLICDIDEPTGQEVAAGIRAKGQIASVAHVDVSQEDQVKRAVEMVATGGEGRIDVHESHLATDFLVIAQMSQEAKILTGIKAVSPRTFGDSH